MTERTVYSIPVYALRFAAHCRSRLRYMGPQDARAQPGARFVSRFWIRLATHEARASLTGKCATQRAGSVTS